MNPSNRQKGHQGELLARTYLTNHQYQILYTNFRLSFGEIDIIAMDQETLVFIEVKSLTKITAFRPMLAVHRQKQQTIKKVAQVFLQTEQVLFDEVRFDVIEVELLTKNIVHTENAF